MSQRVVARSYSSTRKVARDRFVGEVTRGSRRRSNSKAGSGSVICALDVPVLHAGYLRFFAEVAPQAKTLYLFDASLLAETEKLHTEIRAIDPDTMKGLIESLDLFETVEVLTRESIADIAESIDRVITADEEISKELLSQYFEGAKVETVPIFLRWDSKSVYSQQPVNATHTSEDPQDQKMMEMARTEGEKSSCWWRAVGAVLVKDGDVEMLEHNHHVPSDHTPYTNGDPRDLIEAGKDSHLATSLHAEQSIIAAAARQGISLEGSSLYLSVFPCTVCAKLVAYSGIKKVYYGSGHASLDGESILKANDVELILVR